MSKRRALAPDGSIIEYEVDDGLPTRTVVDRAFEVAASTFPRAPRDRLAHPFGFGEHEPYQWRVSRDVWDDLCDYAGMNETDPSPESRLLGEYIVIDEALPVDSMLLEPVP